MDKRPAISVIVPLYNDIQYVRRLVESVLAQTFRDFEFVVVNDASPDDSMSIIETYAKVDSRIVMYSNLRNMGTMWSRYEGIKAAKGDYFVFCDSDDYMPPDALQKMYDAIVYRGDDIVAASSQVVRRNGTMGRVMASRLIDGGGDLATICRSFLSNSIPSALWGKIFSRRLFDGHRYEISPDVTMVEDKMLIYQIVLHASRISVLNEVVYYYCLNSDALTQRRLSPSEVAQVGLYLTFICRILRDVNGIEDALERHITKSLLTFLRRGYDKNDLLATLNIPDREHYLTYRNIRRFYNVVTAILLYIIVNSRGILLNFP